MLFLNWSSREVKGLGTQNWEQGEHHTLGHRKVSHSVRVCAWISLLRFNMGSRAPLSTTKKPQKRINNGNTKSQELIKVVAAYWLSSPTISRITWFSSHIASKEEIQNLRRNLQQERHCNTIPVVIYRHTNSIDRLEHCGMSWTLPILVLFQSECSVQVFPAPPSAP